MGVVRLGTRRLGSLSTTRVLSFRLFQRFVSAQRIDAAAAVGEAIGNVAEVGQPFGGRAVGRRELLKLLEQQDQPEKVAEDHAFLLLWAASRSAKLFKATLAR